LRRICHSSASEPFLARRPHAAKHLLSVSDLDRETILALVENAVAIAQGGREGQRPLAGRIVGIYFRKSSTRTRTAFTVGAMRLGAQVIAYGPTTCR
jgi:ornithine carbamoyltransferase